MISSKCNTCITDTLHLLGITFILYLLKLSTGGMDFTFTPTTALKQTDETLGFFYALIGPRSLIKEKLNTKPSDLESDALPIAPRGQLSTEHLFFRTFSHN